LKGRIAGAALFLLFLALYLATGRALGKTGVFAHDDALFQSDTSRATRDLTEPGADHYRTKVHPLFVILLNPLGTLLWKITGSQIRAAALLVAAAGALCVVMAHAFFRAIGHGAVAALALAVLLGVSASHLVFASIPDTFIFTALSLTVCAWLALRRPGSLAATVPAGVFSMGMATTNLAPASLLFLGGARRDGFWKGVRKTAALVLLVLAVAAALSLFQKKVYPSSNLFFARESFQEDAGYVFIPRVAKRAIVRGEVLFRHLAVFGILAPEPLTRTPVGSPVPWVTFHKATLSGFCGWSFAAALVLLLAAWALAAFGIFRARLHREPLFQSLLLGIAFLAALHYFYGDDLFLYSCSWVFLVIAVLGWGLRGACEAGPRWSWGVNGLLVLLAVLVATNNLAFLRSLADLYDPVLFLL